MATGTDLFDDNAETDEFDGARSAFVKMDDLEGRLLLVTPTDTGERESNLPGQTGKVYTYIVADVAALDGEITDMVDAIPFELEDFQLTGANIVGQLQPKIKRNGKVLGRLTKKKAQQRGFSDAWVLAEPSEEDKQRARQYLAAKRAKAAQADPFASATS